MADWQTLENSPIENIHEAIRDHKDAADARGGQLVAYFGTDGQNLGRKATSFVQCVVLHMINDQDIGNGARVFYIRHTERRYGVRFTRLMREAEITIKLMNKVSPLFDELGIPWEVHVDINSNPRWASYEAYKACKGWFEGFGVKAVFKPNAWVASIVADRHTRGVKPKKGRPFGKRKQTKLELGKRS
jgi:predicted RNase H-related nuclease YkuK (DUF458 family)